MSDASSICLRSYVSLDQMGGRRMELDPGSNSGIGWALSIFKAILIKGCKDL